MGCVKISSISLRIYLKSSHNGDKTGSFSKSLLRRQDKMVVDGNMEELSLQHYCRANDAVVMRHWQFYVVFVVC